MRFKIESIWKESFQLLSKITCHEPYEWNGYNIIAKME